MLVSSRRYNNFAVMIQDRQTHIGCSAVRFKDRNGYKIYWVCNYSMQNVANRAVYVAGTPYTGCISGPVEGFPALCSANESIANVPHKVNPKLATVDGKSNVVNLNKASKNKNNRKRQRRNRSKKTRKTRKRMSTPRKVRRRKTNAVYF